MSKLGVGVGEEFPVDEDVTREEAAPGDDAGSVRWGRGCRFGGPRTEQREALRAWRDQMRAEWRARRRAMREHFRNRYYVEGEDGVLEGHYLRPHHLVVGALAVIGLAALLGRHHNSD